jgi:rubrerythrin
MTAATSTATDVSAEQRSEEKETPVAINLLRDAGVALDQQRFTWRDLVQPPYNKLMDDAFTRVRVILMNGIESEALRFSHACARVNGPLQAALATIRRIEQHQQTLVNWLNPADQDPLETTIGFEQVAIEVTASVAQKEPDPYLAQVFRFGLLEDFDHLYRYSALMDRLQGKDANVLVQSYSDIVPGRPTALEHRHPLDDLRKPYDRQAAAPLTKLHALTIMAGEHQTHDYYMTIGPMFADPIARQVYAEIASIEEQHVTQYESIIDPNETWLEKWLLHEAGEVYNYWSCVESEGNPRVRAIWERFLEYELGHVRFVAELFEETEGRDAAEVLPERLPEPIRYQSHREFVRETLRRELTLSAAGTEFVDREQETDATRGYRNHLNSEGSPTETVAAGYVWRPGTELTDQATRVHEVSSDPKRRAA